MIAAALQKQKLVTRPNPPVLNTPLTELEPLAPWRPALSKALHRNRSQPFARYFQLATVKLDHTPANRTVVFRGFMTDTNHLMMISERRSQKTDQINQNPNAEACWYFTKTREQFRLAGALTLVTADTPKANLRQARQQLWQNISDNARIQFAWPQPKAPRNQAAGESENTDAFNPPPPDEKTPLDTFCLLLLTPHSVDYLSLRGKPQTRILYSHQLEANDSAEPSSPSWQTIPVNP